MRQGCLYIGTELNKLQGILSKLWLVTYFSLAFHQARKSMSLLQALMRPCLPLVELEEERNMVSKFQELSLTRLCEYKLFLLGLI